jgi:hypothetical protein
MSQELITVRPRICRVCGNTILRKNKNNEHISRYLKRRVCSVKCGGKLVKLVTTKITRYCQTCRHLIIQGSESNYQYNNRRFCSRKCTGFIVEPMVPQYCKSCKKIIERKPYESPSIYRNRKFCSKFCVRFLRVLGNAKL